MNRALAEGLESKEKASFISFLIFILRFDVNLFQHFSIDYD